MTSTIGEIQLIAKIDTSQYKKGADEVKKANSEMVATTDEVEQSSGRGTAALASLAKKGFLVAAAGASLLGGAIATMTLGGGISRALNIEDAQAKLKGLGHDTASITTIMDSALASVKGTAFGLDQAATAAASAVAAGIKPGKDLTRVLALTGDTATITGRQFNEAGSIINKVLASNRLSMEEVNQLQDAGLPILSLLAKEYGKTALEMREMVSNGEVDSARFLTAIEKNIGGAALASGNTTRGAWMNMQAAMSRVGAAIVKDIIPKVRDAFGSMTQWFDANSQNIVNAVGRTIDILKSFVSGVRSVASNVAEYLAPKLEALWNTLTTRLIPALNILWKNVIEPLIPVIGTALVVAIGLAIDALNIIVTSISWLITAIQDGNPIILGLIGLFGTLAAVMAFNAVFNALTVGFNILTLVTIPSAMASIGALRGLIASPLVMGAIGIGAALAAIAIVHQALDNFRRDVERTFDNIKRSSDSTVDAMTQLSKLSKTGTPEQQARAKKALAGLAAGGSFASGGFTGMGASDEIAGVVHKGEFVFPKSAVDQVTGTPKVGKSINVTINMAGIIARSRADMRDIGKDIVRALNEELAAKGANIIGEGAI